MIYSMLRIVYHALSGCFTFANAIFSKVGIGLTAAICVMVLVSAILRLFTARFIGGQIVQADERIRANNERAYNNSYEGYRDRRARNEAYDRRYRAEKRGK